MPDRETLRYAYLRWVVAPVIGAMGLDASLRLARRLAREVRRLRSAAWRKACSRCHAAVQRSAADSLNDCRARLRSAPAIIDEMYDHVARFWIEAAFIHRRLRHSSWRSFVHVDRAEELLALRQSGGCLLATACYGNPAVAAVALGELFRPVHVVIDPPRQPLLRKWQEAWCRHEWVRAVERPETAWKVPEILRNGGVVLMFCDQERAAGPAVPTRFLGRTFQAYPTFGRLAGWLQVPIGVVMCRRDPTRPFNFTLTPHGVVHADRTAWTQSPDKECGRLVRQVLTLVERVVMADPAQYFWLLPNGRNSVGGTSGHLAGESALSEQASVRPSGRGLPQRPIPALLGDPTAAHP